MQNKNIYLIGGLGSNGEIFKNFKISSSNKFFIKWKEPVLNENIKEYSIRLLEGLDITKDSILIGVSFGGIIAREIKSQLPNKFKKIIIVSSIKSSEEKSSGFKLLKKIKYLLYLVPNFVLNPRIISPFILKKNSNRSFLVEKYFDLNLTPKYFRWAILNILNWDKEIDNDIWHIHGSNDRIFNINYIKKTEKTVILNCATHLMIITKYREINNIIEKIINENN